MVHLKAISDSSWESMNLFTYKTMKAVVEITVGRRLKPTKSRD